MNPDNTLKRNRPLPVVLILTALMGLHVFFFNNPASSLQLEGIPSWMGPVASLIYNTAALILFFLMLRTNRVGFFRRIFFVSIALLFLPTFIANIIEMRGHMALTTKDIFLNETPFCHIVLPLVAIPYALTQTLAFPAVLSTGYASFFSMLVIWLAATVILGRGWCSWVCFYGGWDDGFSRLRKRPALKISPRNDRLRYGGFAMLLFTLLAGLPTLTVVYCEWFCPFKLITEFEEPTGFKSMLAFILMVLLFFALAIILPLLTRKRVQCGSFCPFGAFQSLAGRVSPFRVVLDSGKCVQCGKCIQACPVMAISPETIKEGRGQPLMTCTLCGECVDVCPAQAVDFGLALQKKPSPPAGSLIKELLHPRSLLPWAGFAFGFVISSGFATGTLYRFFHLLVRGSFVLPGGLF